MTGAHVIRTFPVDRTHLLIGVVLRTDFIAGEKTGHTRKRQKHGRCDARAVRPIAGDETFLGVIVVEKTKDRSGRVNDRIGNCDCRAQPARDARLVLKRLVPGPFAELGPVVSHIEAIAEIVWVASGRFGQQQQVGLDPFELLPPAWPKFWCSLARAPSGIDPKSVDVEFAYPVDERLDD